MAATQQENGMAGSEAVELAQDTEESPLLGPTKQDKDSLDHHRSSDGSTGYSLFVGICFIINYSVGAGILGLPQEFYRGGWALGP